MIGKTISHYKIVEKLGEGGMGVVYKAEDTKLDRIVALKFLPSHLATSESDKARFLQEAKAASAINHPNVCVIYDIQEHEEEQFIIMEYVDGITLNRKMQEGKLELKDVIDYAIQIGEALHAAHNKGIVHRDVKSDNIMVTTTNQIKVMDFGLAKLKGSVKLTKASSTIGTLAYMAPEHLQGADVDARSDIFSFGVVLYEMLAGRLPFKGEYDSAMMYSILNEEPEPIEKHRDDLSPESIHLLNRALEKIPEERYQTVVDMLIDLKRLKRDSSKVSRESLAKMPALEKNKHVKKSKKPIWIICSATVIMLVFLLWFVNQKLHKNGRPESTEVKENSIAVMYFENRTGIENLDKNIVDMLTVNLSRYEQIEVVSSQRLFDILKIIGKAEVDIIDKNVATEIAKHARVKTMLLGSIIKLGSKIRITTQLNDVATGRNIGSEQEDGTSLENIFVMVDSITEKVIDRLGIESSEEQKRIEDVSTNSYYAYNYYIRGKEEYEKRNLDISQRCLETAVKYDSTFAMAYLYLARTYGKLAKNEARNGAYKKAHLFLDKTSEKERLYIAANYALYIEGDNEKSFHFLEELLIKYPNEKMAYYNLFRYYFRKGDESKKIEKLDKVLELDPYNGSSLNQLTYIYANKGNFEKALEYVERYVSVSPGDPNPIDTMAEMLFKVGRFDEAIAKYEEVIKITPDFSLLPHFKIAYIYALRENYTESLNWINQLIEVKNGRLRGYLWRGFYRFWLGELNHSMDDYDTVIKKATDQDEFWKVSAEWLKGWIYYEKREFEKSRNVFQECFNYWIKIETAFKSFWMSRYYVHIGLVDLQQGRINDAKEKLDKIKSLFAESEYPLEQYGRPTQIKFDSDFLQSNIFVAERKYETAYNISTKIINTPFFSIQPSTLFHLNLPFEWDILARSLYRTGKLEESISEYERIINFDPLSSNERRLIHPKYHYRLAKLYEEKGSKEKAIQQYQKFLEIWKNADDDLPEKIDAQKRLANLLNQG